MLGADFAVEVGKGDFANGISADAVCAMLVNADRYGGATDLKGDLRTVSRRYAPSRQSAVTARATMREGRAS